MASRKKSTLNYPELSQMKASMENLMLCKEIGVTTSLLLHRNIKLIKPLILDYDEEYKVIKNQCYRTTPQGELFYDDKGNLEVLPDKFTQLKNSIEALNKRTVEINFEVLNLSELPAKLGQSNGIEFYQFVPPLFDIIYVEDQEYKDLGI